MNPETQREKPQSRTKKHTRNFFTVPLLVLLILAAFFFLVPHLRKNASLDTGDKEQGIWERISQTFSDKGKAKSTKTTTPEQSDKFTSEGNKPAEHQSSIPNTDQSTILPTATSGQPSVFPIGSAESNQQATEIINNFFSHLDTQPYIQNLHLEKQSKVYFTEIIQKILDNPPVILRETDDLVTVLKNTAHFYRVMGKENITILKSILAQEKPYTENTLASYYALAECPDCLQKNFSLTVTPERLYDYASFFLNTMGGRLYLFRRDPVTRLTVNYYAILEIDRANRVSNNRNGVQIKPAIDTLISEMENSGTQLQLKERYLDKLYELKEKYQ
jgi:hypothetical protein